MTVLIVEDNAGIRRLLRRTLVDTASVIWECADGSDALANKIGNHPVLLPLLDVFDFQRRQFRAAETAAQQNRECGVVALSAQNGNVRRPQKALALLRTKPIANGNTQSLGALHPSNPSSEIGAQKTAIGRLVSQPPNCSESQVDGG